jgi:hypothetical protein
MAENNKHINTAFDLLNNYLIIIKIKENLRNILKITIVKKINN